MKKRNAILLTFILVLGLWGQAHALLLSRLGGAAVYDDDLDVTWLADANAGAGSSFVNGFSTIVRLRN